MRRRKRRSVNAFSLSFLDVMSCGFGAAVLIFMLIKHNVAELALADSAGGSEEQVQLQSAEELEESITQLTQQVAMLNQDIAKTQKEITTASAKIASLLSKAGKSNRGELDALMKKLKDKEAALANEREKSRQNIDIAREGRRQYLTGLQVEGKRIAVLLDKSASMLDEELVSIIRSKYLSATERRKADKWRWGMSIFNWLMAHLPRESSYRAYAFNDKLQSLTPKKIKGWVPVKNQSAMRVTLANLRKLAPERGTNLQNAFRRVIRDNPRLDAIYLITDGLPTLSLDARPKQLVSASDRFEMFGDAVDELTNRNIPVYTIMLPIKGDPQAPGAFWHLSALSQGKFLAPTRDWP